MPKQLANFIDRLTDVGLRLVIGRLGDCAIGRAGTSVDRAAMEVCGSLAVGVCRPGVESPGDSDPLMEEAPLQPHKHRRKLHVNSLHYVTLQQSYFSYDNYNNRDPSRK